MGLPSDPAPDQRRSTEKSRGDQAQVKLGRYEVVRELGKGAMGIVYLAKDPLIGRLVALKTIRPAAHADDDEAREFQQRFIREAQAAGILNHPAIVTVHDIGQDDATGVSFIAMEYVEGQNLKDVLAQGRPLSFEQIGDIIAQVAEGLDFAHAKGIVHRDVKPANIILLEGNRAKITDFGIAKIASGAANLTTTGQFLGTPNYMAPEQIKGTPVDGRTDIFSLGICLYECLTRRKPFGGDSLTSISYKIVHESFPPLQEINPQIPTGFEDVVAKALAKEPAKRYQRAREMANALRAVNRGEKPPVEPMQVDETVVTRETVAAPQGKIPTIEMPFPDAAVAEDIGTNAVKPKPVPVRTAKAAPAAGGAPLLRRKINPLLFIIICAALIAGLVGAVVALRARQAAPVAVDAKLEAQRLRERTLRTQGNDLLRQGRVSDAYVKFEELNRIAPNSPATKDMLQKLGAMRQQEESNKAQLANAKAKLDQGIALYNQKNFPAAIPILQEAFQLNPNSSDAANYLKLAQFEQQRIDAEKAAKKATAIRPPGAATTTAPVKTAANGKPVVAAPSNDPARITTTFTPTVADGYLMVRVGSQMIVRENLWEERGRFVTRRKVVKPVNVTSSFTPVNADVDVWVVIPTLKVQEHRTIARQNFQPGSAHTLHISFDPGSKQISCQIN